MTRDLNKVMIIGHLGANPRLHSMDDGTPVATFRVASSRRWLSEDGASHNDTEWFRVVAWNKLAERCAAYLHKGTRVYIEGRLQTRTWQDRVPALDDRSDRARHDPPDRRHQLIRRRNGWYRHS